MIGIFLVVSILAINKYMNSQRLLKMEKKLMKLRQRELLRQNTQHTFEHKNRNTKNTHHTSRHKKTKNTHLKRNIIEHYGELSMEQPIKPVMCYMDIKNYGRIKIELFNDVTPKTCENFRLLCENKKYVGVPFHRIIKGFMVQGGDITNKNGSGSYSIYGRQFNDENFIHKHTEAGLLSMANSGPNTNGSQFFITTNPQPHLDGKHVVFGKVISGMDIIYKLERIPTDSSDKPIHNVVVEDCGCF
jgi:cyclophilin family peptidyl-prolyl cis-trans isomerase